jgi:tellurite resistance protein
LPDILSSLSSQDALIAVMVAISAADEHVPTSELIAINRIIDHMPIFASYDIDRAARVSKSVYALFEEEDGLEALFGLIRADLPERLYETAYALACDVAAADGTIRQTELRMLEEIRSELAIDRLHAVAIERGARARHMTL